MPVVKRVLLAGALIVAACSDGGVLSNPLIRVSRIDRLPKRERRLIDTAMPFDCRRKVDLSASGVQVAFVVTWRVLDFAKSARHGKSRYISAVQVGPAGDGRVAGVRGLKGSAWVGDSKNGGTANEVIAEVPVRVGWSAEKGCDHIERSETIVIRADDSSCKKPKMPKLLRPVK